MTPVPEPVVRAARAEAAQAAAAAEVIIAEVREPDELDELRRVMEAVWGAEIVPPRNLLRGLALGGNCLLLARPIGDGEADGVTEPVGFALGWLGWSSGVHFHSHQVGVRAGTRGGGVGYALKLAQRALCLEHGITEMRWTYDPMLMSNARFNLIRLGAEVVDFIPHCYGDRRDAFNTGERTDRFEVSWRLDARIGREVIDASRHAVVPVPADYAALRAADSAAAAATRTRVGAQLADALARGARVLGVCEAGYVLDEPGGLS